MLLPRHVISLAAIFVCNILLSQAQSSPNAALLKLLAAKRSHDHTQGVAGLSPASSSSYLNEYSPSSVSFPSDLSAGDSGDEFWLESAAAAAAAAESNPMLMRGAGSSLTSAGSATSEEEAEDGKSGLAMAAGAASKRFHPSAFFGSRGKRVSYGALSDEGLAKRFFHQGFVGSRGKRLREGAEEEEEEEEEGKRMSKRFDPSGFSGSRGKRYLPGLEALFLSQMYKKLDAEKWKRQSLLGFHAARG